MPTFLFDETIFGPVVSRRLGISLGINLLPNDSKLCSFDCIYCECGWNPEKGTVKAILPKQTEVKQLLSEKLQTMKSDGTLPDVITFAGNGEPTMHPEFAAIIDDTVLIRNELCPAARIAVLSNSTMLHKPAVVEALKKWMIIFSNLTQGFMQRSKCSTNLLEDLILHGLSKTLRILVAG